MELTLRISRERVVLVVAVVLVAALMAGGCGSLSPAQPAYPTGPISLLVAYPAGGATDIQARVVADRAAKELGQPITVVNKGGAGGQLGWTELAMAKPDGYFIGLVNLPALNTVILDPSRKATFDLDAFVPLVNQVIDPGAVYAKADSPYKTLKDLVDDVKKRPEQVKIGMVGILSDDHLAIMMLQQAAGIKLSIVNFDGGAPMMTALQGGHIDAVFDNVGGTSSQVKSGQLKGLAVMNKEKSKFLPGVPTTVEMGYPTMISSSSRGIVGPKGLPQPIVNKLQGVLKKAMENPEDMAKMEQSGLETKVMVGEEYGKYMKELHSTVKPLVELALKSS